MQGAVDATEARTTTFKQGWRRADPHGRPHCAPQGRRLRRPAAVVRDGSTGCKSCARCVNAFPTQLTVKMRTEGKGWRRADPHGRPRCAPQGRQLRRPAAWASQWFAMAPQRCKSCARCVSASPTQLTVNSISAHRKNAYRRKERAQPFEVPDVARVDGVTALRCRGHHDRVHRGCSAHCCHRLSRDSR